jgi:hypothetical protein
VILTVGLGVILFTLVYLNSSRFESRCALGVQVTKYQQKQTDEYPHDVTDAQVPAYVQ